MHVVRIGPKSMTIWLTRFFEKLVTFPRVVSGAKDAPKSERKHAKTTEAAPQEAHEENMRAHMHEKSQLKAIKKSHPTSQGVSHSNAPSSRPENHTKEHKRQRRTRKIHFIIRTELDL